MVKFFYKKFLEVRNVSLRHVLWYGFPIKKSLKVRNV